MIVIQLLNIIDVKIFGPVKTSLRALVHRWYADNTGKVMNKTSMIRDVARPAFEAALSRTETIKKGFQMTGIYPFDPSAANRDKLKAGNIFQSSSTSTQSTTEGAEVLAEMITSPVEDIPPPNSVLLASAMSNCPADADAPLSYVAVPGQAKEQTVIAPGLRAETDGNLLELTEESELSAGVTINKVKKFGGSNNEGLLFIFCPTNFS